MFAHLPYTVLIFGLSVVLRILWSPERRRLRPSTTTKASARLKLSTTPSQRDFMIARETSSNAYWYVNCAPTGFGLLIFVQVLEPSERLGVQPKSSHAQLRAHHFFVGDGTSQDPTYIRWDALWADPPLQPETGIIPPSNDATFGDDGDNDELWDSVVHEFSLSSISPPNGFSLPPHDNIPPVPLVPVDVPPDMVPCEVIELPKSATEEADDGAARTFNDIAVIDGDITLAAKNWCVTPSRCIRSNALTQRCQV